MGILRVFTGLPARLRPPASLLGACTLACACAATLPAGASAAECANEARRAEQNTTFLPDCRAYERVSPEEKGGGDIVGEGDTVIAGNLGEEAFKRGEGAVVFNSRSAFGDEVGTGVDGQSTYVARRGAAGWASHAATPKSNPEALQALFLMTKVETFSADLTRAIVWGYDLPGGGGPPERANVYAEDVATRGLQALAIPQAGEPLQLEFSLFPTNETDWGVSADAQHVALVPRQTRLLPSAAEGVPNVYQWDAGKGLSLAGILPDGKVPEGGSEVPYANPGAGYRASMSADGSRLVFSATPPGSTEPQLYMRIGGSMTVPISTPSGSSVFSAKVALQAVTPDGRNVFFVTDTPLVPEDTNSGPDLYRWTDSGDPAHDGTLTAITTSGDFSLAWSPPIGVIGVSDDGTRVYYQTLGAQLVVWDNGTSRVITTEAPVDSQTSMAAVASQPGLGRVSPDGKWLAFISDATLGNNDVHPHPIAPDPAGTPASELTLEKNTYTSSRASYEMYSYSLKTGRLVCVSCFSGGAIPNAAVTPDVTSGVPALAATGIRPSFLSGNGKVFFSTTAALLPQDTNGVEDVYEYDGETGKLSLLSPGTGSEPTSFGDASANGEDVFVLTRRQLLSEDRDSLVDLYDVRTNGGFAAPVSGVGCVADECQPQPSPAPAFTVPASVGFAGAGNLPAGAGKPVAAKGRSNKRKLARALRACKRKRGRVKRKQCEAKARGRYGRNAKNSSRGSK